MSGGHFNHKQWHIRNMAEELEDLLQKQGKEINLKEFYHDESWFEKYPEDRYHTVYSNEVQQIMKDGIKALKIAYIYAQRLDWYLSGDDGEDNLVKRLSNELKQIKYNTENE